MDKAKALVETCERIYELASKEIGTTETPGPENNPRILEYHSATGGQASLDSIPWCSSFACWVLERCGIPSTKSAWARNFLDWGTPIDKPVKGCIAVFSRDNNKGHVGFYDHEDDALIYVLGGNQHDRVCVAGYGKERLLGYRMPNIKLKLFSDLIESNAILGEYSLVYRDKISECKNNIPSRDLEL